MSQSAKRCAALAAALMCTFSSGARADDLPTLAPIIEKVAPGVVKVEVIMRTGQQPPPAENVSAQSAPPPGDASVQRSPGRRNPALRRKSAESGVTFDSTEGLIVVNQHVIAKADRIVVTRRLRATLVGADPETDLALIRVPAENLIAVPFADSTKVSVGDYAISIGYPFDVGQTVSLGIVSAVHRSGLGFGPYEDFLQTDAPANPGDAGAALLNLQGELIGLNTAVYGNGPNVGIAAIPANLVRTVAEQIAKYGAAQHPSLGMAATDLTPDLARERKLRGRQTGALIATVNPGSAAANAGLEVGDIVTAIGTTPVHDAADLLNNVLQLGIGDTVKLDVLRNGDRLSVPVKLAARDLADK
jgi:S1-C subfamily serine protease